jgi:hypothetical protein
MPEWGVQLDYFLLRCNCGSRVLVGRKRGEGCTDNRRCSRAAIVPCTALYMQDKLNEAAPSARSLWIRWRAWLLVQGMLGLCIRGHARHVLPVPVHRGSLRSIYPHIVDKLLLCLRPTVQGMRRSFGSKTRS